MNLVEKFSDSWHYLTGSANNIVAFVVSIAVFAVLYYYIIKFLIDNSSNILLALFVVAMVVSAGVISFLSNINYAIYLLVPWVFIIAILILYSVEIKRSLWSSKNGKVADIKHEGLSYDEQKIENCILEIIKALQNMSKNDVGALIVLADRNFPAQILDSGIKLNSDISSELIESVFFPKTPLHDGAMIINGTNIVSAGCFLPLPQSSDNIPKDFGSRHRAGIGITETIDVVSIIVSEETGIISIARGGKMTRYADTDMLRNTLSKYYWQEIESARK